MKQLTDEERKIIQERLLNRAEHMVELAQAFTNLAELAQHEQASDTFLGLCDFTESLLGESFYKAAAAIDIVGDMTWQKPPEEIGVKNEYGA